MLSCESESLLSFYTSDYSLSYAINDQFYLEYLKKITFFIVKSRFCTRFHIAYCFKVKKQ